MDPTTLVTFLFKAPAEVRTVELYGSWDNFSLPYRMHHDRRRGAGVWTGCFSFENIVFDGDSLQWTKARSGGLKQGGTYWYYFRLNYDLEAYDDMQPCTNSCPLLPGQTINIIEVPMEIVRAPARRRSAHAIGDILGTLSEYNNMHTLDPATKYAAIEPPPKSRFHKHCISDDALNGRLENPPLAPMDDGSSPTSPSPWRMKRTLSIASKASARIRRSVSIRKNSVCSQISSGDARSRPESILDAYGESRHTASPSLYDSLSSFSYPSMRGPSPLPSSHGSRPPSRYRHYADSAALDDSTNSNVSPTDSVWSSRRDSKNSTHTATRPQPIPIPIHQRPQVSNLSCSPDSVQNVQFYGSRPSSPSEDPANFRPRMYSLPNLNLQDARGSADDPVETVLTHSQTAPDLVSPTYSTFTISTNGHNTPNRLSVVNSHEADDCEWDAPQHDVPETVRSLDDASDRLQNLTISHDLPSRTRSATRLLTPPGFVNYSLPTFLSNESMQSLTKTISTPSIAGPNASRLPVRPSVFTGAVPPPVVTAGPYDVLADLGYLGESIA